MAGVLAAFGAPDADVLVRRAARPLLRRDWQRCEVVAAAPGVALGVAGERIGVASDPATNVLAVLEGELFDDEGVRSGGDAAHELLSLFLRDGPALEPPQGIFAAVFWDGRDRSLTIVTDRYARRPVYVARLDGATLVAGELKSLVAAGVKPVLDVGSWAEFLAYEGLVSDRTALEGVRLLPSAGTLTVREDGEEELRKRWRYRVEPAEQADERELVEEFGRLMERAVRRRLSPDLGIALSGGLDSRTVASILRRLAPQTTALSYGWPRAEDLRLGGVLARAAGLPHREVVFEPGYIEHGAAETVWLSEGNIRSFHVHHLALRALRASDDRRAVLVNFGGDHTVRTVGGPFVAGGAGAEPLGFHRARAKCLTDELLEELLAPAFAAELRGRARDSVVAQLAREEGSPLARIRQFGFENQRHKIWPGAELFADDLAPRDPYDDHDLVEFCRRMPEHLRRFGVLQRAYLAAEAPDLAAVRNVKDGVRPDLAGRRRQAAVFAVRARRGARRRLDRVLGAGWRVDRSGLGDYAADLRRAGHDLLGILLEPRTLERNQLRAEPVRRLVDETLRGRARHTRVLGVLLTFELFQRQFVDGDGYGTTERIAPRSLEPSEPIR